MSILRVSIIVLILVANASIVFLRLDSEPFLDVPADKMRIEQREVRGDEEIMISVNAAWVRGWYSDAVAAFTVVMALTLLFSLLRTTRTDPPRSSVKVTEPAR